ncbi:MAG TPA: UDP-N-acetylglucosamine 2-epimerase (non-hydrolyzing) [Thermoanaerobaculia bacterium]|nr:UDP-N-acetylglucosamine 2-epimerase (non-hydrolyzing) [Thermoanaerobaculia bacterium]
MKVVTLFGTRPEIIRLSRVIDRLDQHAEQILVHTGQNHDPTLSDIFFRDLAVRQPNVHLGVRAGSFPEQAAQILERSAQVLERERPDRLLILGDTNSGLACIIAARMRIPVFHMEAGNRSYDDRIPEEINRRIIDHSSNVLMPYTNRSKEALVREGIERRRIYVTGNPIYEVLEHYGKAIDGSSVLTDLGLREKEFFLVTLHRAENVDEPERLDSFLQGLTRVADAFDKPMVVSVHPRTADKMKRYGLSPQSDRVRLLSPLGFFEFVKLEKTAFCVLSDSGTVQEECCIFKVPNVTLRDVTERPETIECGSNILSGADPQMIETAVRIATSRLDWDVPSEYVVRNVSQTVTKIVLGYRQREFECP